MNIDAEQPMRLQSRTSIVWSLTGGTGANDNPADAEHLVLQVEAMGTGNIPILTDRGGLQELVGGNKSLLLHHTRAPAGKKIFECSICRTQSRPCSARGRESSLTSGWRRGIRRARAGSHLSVWRREQLTGERGPVFIETIMFIFEIK